MHKSKLAVLDPKLTAELAPKHDENDVTENKQEQPLQSQPDVKAETVTPLMSIHRTLRKDISPQWWRNLMQFIASAKPHLSNYKIYEECRSLNISGLHCVNKH